MIMTVEQLMEKFQMSRETVLNILRQKNSGAMKTGTKNRSGWRIEEEKFVKILTDNAKLFQG